MLGRILGRVFSVNPRFKTDTSEDDQRLLKRRTLARLRNAVSTIEPLRLEQRLMFASTFTLNNSLPGVCNCDDDRIGVDHTYTINTNDHATFTGGDPTDTVLTTDGTGLTLTQGLILTDTNAVGNSSIGNLGGNGVVASDAPELVKLSNTSGGSTVLTYVVVLGSDNQLWFDETGAGTGLYDERYGGSDTFSIVASAMGSPSVMEADYAGSFVVTQADGTDLVFDSGTGATSLKLLAEFDTGGASTTFGYNAAGALQTVQRNSSAYSLATNSFSNTYEKFLYTYLTTGSGNIGSISLSNATDDVNWKAVGSVSYLYNSSNDLYLTNAEQNSMSAPSSSLASGSLSAGTYYYQVSPIFSEGGTDHSEGDPSGELAVAFTGSKNVTLSWAAVPNAAGYKIYRGSQTGQETIIGNVSSGATTTFTDNGITAGTQAPENIGIAYYTYTNIGGQDLVQYVFGADAYARLSSALPSGDDIPQLASSTDLLAAQYANFADVANTYNTSNGDIQTQTLAGSGLTQFSYNTSSSSNGYQNSWATETTETQPDGTKTGTFYNGYGQNLLTVTADSGTGEISGTYNSYDETDGLLNFTASPSAVILPWTNTRSFNSVMSSLGSSLYLVGPSDGVYTDLALHSGLITGTSYTTSDYFDSTSLIAPMPSETTVQEGLDGTLVEKESWTYLVLSTYTNPIDEVDSDTIYPSASGSTGLRETDFAYTAGSDGGLLTETITQPTVATSQDGPGPGTAVSTESFFDADERTIAVAQNVSGTTGYDIALTAFDPATGATIKMVQDAPSYVVGGTTILSSADTTATALNLVTTMLVDAQGRTVKEKILMAT